MVAEKLIVTRPFHALMDKPLNNHPTSDAYFCLVPGVIVDRRCIVGLQEIVQRNESWRIRSLAIRN